MTRSAAVAGAGLAGRLLAMRLLEQGWQVSLFDKDDPAGKQSCGLTAAGMLAPCAEIETADSRIFDLGIQSMQLWPEIIARLTRKTGRTIYWRHQGSLILAHHQDQMELQRFVTNLHYKLTNRQSDRLTSQPVTAEAHMQPVNAAEIIALEPELTSFRSGYFFPQEAQIAADDLFPALQDFILQHDGVVWRSHVTVDQINGNTIHYQDSSDHKSDTFDLVCDCRGLGAQHQLPDLHAVRGELLWLETKEVHITRPVRLMHPRYRLYLVPRPEHIYIIGASEIETEDYSPVSVRTSLELLSAAYSIHPAFAEARIVQSRVNCRPAFSDHQPKVIVQSEQGYCAINGLYRHGYLLAPALVEQVIKKVKTL